MQRLIEKLKRTIPHPLLKKLVGSIIALCALSIPTNKVLSQPIYQGGRSSLIEQFQETVGLPVTGRYDSRTRLLIIDIQRQLGLHPTGFYDPVTRSAVAQVQRQQGLRATGMPDERTLQALGFSVAGRGGVTNQASFMSDNRPVSYLDRPLSRRYAPVASNLRISEPYIVLIPNSDFGTLNRVKRYVPCAFIDKAKPGLFINAGQFPNYSSANDVTNQLRRLGFDARVFYRP